jgi:hypothetical protein
VHINFGAELESDYEDTKQLAAEIDRQILGGYRLFPVHYLAYAMSDLRRRNRCRAAESLFRRRGTGQGQRRMAAPPAAMPERAAPYLVLQYATRCESVPFSPGRLKRQMQ